LKTTLASIASSSNLISSLHIALKREYASKGDLAEIEAFLIRVLGETVAAQLIQCLIDAGIAFPTDTDAIRTLR
jgi:hypothetical protein